MKIVIEQLLDKEDMSQTDARNIMLEIMSGEYNDAQIAGFLIALRAKDTTSAEIAGFVEAMREKMTKVDSNSNAIDMCGTGGDASGTFNISTAASFVVAGANVPVAKHGNRSMTSKSGSADVLSALGINITLPQAKVAECINNIGIGFMFAPALHPAMKYAMGARSSLGVRTVFNLLGPLCNPAAVKRQLMGIYDGSLTNKIAHVLKKLGSNHAMVVHGYDGLDEISTTGKTMYAELKPNSNIYDGEINPDSYDIPIVKMESLMGGVPTENAKIIMKIFNGERGPARDIVVLNAAAGILVGGKVEKLEDGIKLAEDVIDSGTAKNKLKLLSEVH